MQTMNNASNLNLHVGQSELLDYIAELSILHLVGDSRRSEYFPCELEKVMDIWEWVCAQMTQWHYKICFDDLHYNYARETPHVMCPYSLHILRSLSLNCQHYSCLQITMQREVVSEKMTPKILLIIAVEPN